jgi:hypothetical protein
MRVVPALGGTSACMQVRENIGHDAMKNPWAFSDRDEWRAGMETFMSETGGTVRVVVINRRDMPDVIEAVKAGDPFAFCVASIINQTARKLSRKPSMLCLTCDRVATVKRTEAFLVMLPTAFNVNASGIASPICRICLAKPQFQNVAMAALQKSFGFEVIADESVK